MKSTFSWTNPKLEVKNTGEYKRGVFAKENIRKGEMLSVFGVYVMTIKDERKLPEDYNDTGVQIHDKFVLGIKKRDELEDADYFNHSCNPNAGFNGQIFLVAIRNIKRGEEIAFDYAMAISRTKASGSYKFKCLCGAKNCRKEITNNDWKIPSLKRKYKGYFQWYLENKIKK